MSDMDFELPELSDLSEADLDEVSGGAGARIDGNG